MLLSGVMQKREAARRGADEVILHGEDGTLHEGASSTVFLIKDETLIEPETDGKVLPGTTGILTIEAASSMGLRFETRPVQVAELFTADEVLLTATSRLALGIHTIDGKPIANATGSGPWTQNIAAAIRERYGITD